MFNNTHDGFDTVLNIFCPYLRDFEGFIKNALTRSIFELEKCFFFFMVQNFARVLVWH